MEKGSLWHLSKKARHSDQRKERSQAGALRGAWKMLKARKKQPVPQVLQVMGWPGLEGELPLERPRKLEERKGRRRELGRLFS